jgi:type IV pilus assembly protein PilW
MKNSSSPQLQSGINMVEIMIALLIGVFLIGGLIQMFIGSKKTYNLQDASSRLQENGRFAAEFISVDVHDADFWGCITDKLNVLYPIGVAPVVGLSGVDNDDADPDIIDGTDSITLRGFKSDAILVTEDSGNTAAPLVIAKNTAGNLKKDDWVIVTDCKFADVFQVVSLTNGPTADTFRLNHRPFLIPYGAGAQIFKWYGVTYDIREGANKQPALFKSEFELDGTPIGGAQELVEGIENMQILYGEDTDLPENTDGLPNYYLSGSAADAVNLDNVKGVRISLLAQSENNLASKPISYTYNGVTTTPNDTRIRNVYDMTLAIRSRLK